ncbi:MAG: hypothetical protein HY426_04950 [Candidatus Levybacteria bacterium]|nr:hypothetical protein [Candidatus Levybacteria bacterium]
MSPDRETFRRRAAEVLGGARDSIGKTAASAFWEASRRGFRYEIVDPNEHFQRAKDKLEGEDWDSAIVVYDSLGVPGAAMIADAIERHLAPLNMVAAIAELEPPMSHPGESMPSKALHKAQRSLIKGVTGSKGFEFLPETLQKRGEHSSDPQRFTADISQTAVDFLKTNGHVLVIPQPTKNGALKRANPRLYAIWRLSRRGTFLFPMVIESDMRRLVPPYSKVRLIPGEPRSLEDYAQRLDAIQLTGRDFDVTMTDLIMTDVAKLFTVSQRRGYYGKYIPESRPVSQA